MSLNANIRQFFQCCVCHNAGFDKYMRCDGPQVQHVHCSDCAEQMTTFCSTCGEDRTFTEDKLLSEMSVFLVFKCRYATCAFEGRLTQHENHRITCLGMTGGVCPVCEFEATTTSALTEHILRDGSPCLMRYPCYKFTEGRSGHFTLSSPLSPIAATDGYYWLMSESADYGVLPHLLRLEVASTFCPETFVITVVYMGSAKDSRNLLLRLTLHSSGEDALKISQEYRIPNCRIRWLDLLKNQYGLAVRLDAITCFRETVLNHNANGIELAFRLELELTDDGFQTGACRQVKIPKPPSKRQRPLNSGTSTSRELNEIESANQQTGRAAIDLY